MAMSRTTSTPKDTGHPISATQAAAKPTMFDGMPVVKHWNPSLASGAIGVVCYFAFWSIVALAVGSVYALAVL